MIHGSGVVHKEEGIDINGEDIFCPVSDGDVIRAIVGTFAAELEEYVWSDVIVVGAGPSGLAYSFHMRRRGEGFKHDLGR